MRTSPYRNIRVKEEVCKNVDSLAPVLGWGKNQFVENCISEIITLINTPPNDRSIPKMVALIDAAQELELQQPSFPPKVTARIKKMSGREMADEITRDIGKSVKKKRKAKN